MRQRRTTRSLAMRGLIALAGLTALILCALPARTQPPEQLPAPSPGPGQPAELLAPAQEPATELPPPRQAMKLSAVAAVEWALRNNPQLATFRKQRGLAQAGVVIADQYPFNPILQHYVWYGNGPASAGVTNHLFQEHTSRLDLEVNGQGKYRRAAARSALTRNQWETAAQELLIAVQVARAFNTLLYRQGKYHLLEQTVQFQEQTARLVGQLVEQNKLSSIDQLLARADVNDAVTALGPGHSLLVVAENDFRRVLGLLREEIDVEGTLEKGYTPPETGVLVQAALERRPDLRGLKFAVEEAENRLRFEIANRWGNPSLGPSGEINETSVGFFGLWMIWQLPVINQRRGEIQLRKAMLAQALQSVRQSEIQIQQDVYAALSRLAAAERVVNTFRQQTLPELRATREAIDKLFEQGQPGVDLARVIAIRLRLLRTRDAYLDALWEYSQAQADLAAAVADLSLAGCAPPLPAASAPTPPADAPPR